LPQVAVNQQSTLFIDLSLGQCVSKRVGNGKSLHHKKQLNRVGFDLAKPTTVGNGVAEIWL